jgi:hypothetical protein
MRREKIIVTIIIIIFTLVVAADDDIVNASSLNEKSPTKNTCQILSPKDRYNLLEDYWARPIPIQGKAPDGFTELESSLYPEDCGVCHQLQYADWSGSIHSMAVSPGLIGQLSPYKDPDFAISCYFCHAPLSEQQEYVVIDGEYKKNESFDERLKKSGVNCGVCHLREYRRFGPSPIKSRKPGKAHDGFIESRFFEQSEFCAACHQFPEGATSINGKLLENTYQEWLASPYPAKGISCQGCHMPDRRHFFRGIHDREMVASGVDIVVEEKISGLKKGAVLIITNSGTGHYFPTYVTPLIVVRGALLDKNGVTMEASIKEEYVGRRISLDLSREIADTRIPPMGSFVFDYLPEYTNDAKKVSLEVWVYPDSFYNEFFKALLGGGFFSSKKEIETALAATENSPYLLFRREMDIF